MPKNTQKKSSNVVKLPVGKPSNNPWVFHVSGDVKPPVKIVDDNGKEIAVKNEDMKTGFEADLDFTGVDMQDILRMASQTIVIKLAGNCRQKFSAGYNTKTKQHAKSFASIVRETIPAQINVKEQVASKLRPTVKVSRTKKIEKEFGGLSTADKAEMLKKLQDSLKASNIQASPAMDEAKKKK